MDFVPFISLLAIIQNHKWGSNDAQLNVIMGPSGLQSQISRVLIHDSQCLVDGAFSTKYSFIPAEINDTAAEYNIAIKKDCKFYVGYCLDIPQPV